MEQKITLYHSELVRMGDVRAVVETEVSPSKYANKPEWVMLNIDGRSRRYDTENPSCADALRGLRGQHLLIRASGSRDAAVIEILSEPDTGSVETPVEHEQPQPAPYRQPQPAPMPRQALPQRQAPQRQAAPVQDQHARPDAVLGAKRQLCRLANGYTLAIRAGQFVRGQHDALNPNAPMTDEQFQAMVSTLFIGADKRGCFDDLPSDSAV
jgi:hypothetical protein